MKVPPDRLWKITSKIRLLSETAMPIMMPTGVVREKKAMRRMIVLRLRPARVNAPPMEIAAGILCRIIPTESYQVWSTVF